MLGNDANIIILNHLAWWISVVGKAEDGNDAGIEDVKAFEAVDDDSDHENNEDVALTKVRSIS